MIPGAVLAPVLDELGTMVELLIELEGLPSKYEGKALEQRARVLSALARESLRRAGCPGMEGR